MKKIILSLICSLTIFNACEKVVFNNSTTNTVDVTPPTVTATIPTNIATGITPSQIVTVTFDKAMDPLTINATTFTIKQGSTSVTGTVTYNGTQATFVSSTSLALNTIYTGTITTGAKDIKGNALISNYTFTFTTGSTPDTTPPTVSSTDPLNSAVSVALSSAINVYFNKAMNASTINTTTFTVKQGSTAVAGTVTLSGTKASFTPTVIFSPTLVYTATITTGVKDLVGNAMISSYTFSFTTGTVVDVTPPTVVSTDPISGATGVATNKAIGITFSEAMTPTTITTTTFTLNEGTTAVAGTVAYTGTTATFTPSSLLIAGTVYTAAISTGAKDLAGNALKASTTWNFTTAGTAPGLSFATDVIPVLNICESCHSHGWTPSSNASTYYTNLVSRGYVKPSTYTSSAIYTKLQSGHPGTGNVSKANTDKIINWMIQGSKNN